VVVDRIAEHARMEHPRECCGLLIGTPGHILESVPLENVAVDGMRRYQISPADYLAQIRRCRERGDVAVVGAYHSHPRSEAQPSPTDVDEAFEHFWFLIAGPVSADEPLQIHAYQLVDGRMQEEVLAVGPA
jgi:proteasome lid subunit RPN8/RPN11